jgi:hypothetical protein
MCINWVVLSLEKVTRSVKCVTHKRSIITIFPWTALVFQLQSCERDTCRANYVDFLTCEQVISVLHILHFPWLIAVNCGKQEGKELSLSHQDCISMSSPFCLWNTHTFPFHLWHFCHLTVGTNIRTAKHLRSYKSCTFQCIKRIYAHRFVLK